MAYYAQEAWLTNDTVKNNIIFTYAWNGGRYNAVVEACCLAPDLAILKDCDSTMVGENGVSLSGGQKQRVALARAVYSDSSYVFLDDCLSAVDSHAAKWLFENCITGPLMKGRTCILATHNVALTIPGATSITILSNGNIAASGSPSQLNDCKALTELQGSGVVGDDNHQPNNHPKSGFDNFSARPALPVNENLNEDQSCSDKNNTASLDSGFTAPKSGGLNHGPSDPLTQRSPGHTPPSVIWAYLSSMGGLAFWVLIAFFFAAQQIIAFSADWWLREFANAYSATAALADPESKGVSTNQTGWASTAPITPPVNVWYYLGIYAATLALYTLVSFGRLYAASIGSLSASDVMHKQLLSAILQGKFEFFDRTSHGTLLNCFSQDVQTVEHNVMPMALGTLHFLVMSVFTIILIALLTPSFLLPGVFIMVAYLVIGRLFSDTSRELERIKSQQREPLYQHVSESLLGVITIRAFGKEQRFIRDNYTKIDKVNQPSFYVGAVDRWLAFRLNITGTAMSFIAGYFALASIGKVSPGAIGLTLTYAITFSENILWMVRYHALNQQNFAA